MQSLQSSTANLPWLQAKTKDGMSGCERFGPTGFRHSDPGESHDLRAVCIGHQAAFYVGSSTPECHLALSPIVKKFEAVTRKTRALPRPGCSIFQDPPAQLIRTAVVAWVSAMVGLLPFLALFLSLQSHNCRSQEPLERCAA